MTLDEFLRIYPLRAPNLMWFLGAGASAAAGIPTAADLIWEFKRSLYCSATRVSLRACADLASAALRNRLDAHFANIGGFPPAGAAEEYAAFFEAAYPDPSDRRILLDRFLTGAKPSFGHVVLAAFMKAGQTRLLWTTNFDRLIEDSGAGSGLAPSQLIVAAIDNAATALEGLNEGRWPLLAKLHGDFQSRRLKNTSDELCIQDATLRRALVESARRFGLVVIGYSGRDESIMDALEEGIAKGQGYPSGLFWFERPEHPILPRVTRLLAKANAAGVNACLLHTQTFDELLGDIVKQMTNLPGDVLEKFDQQKRRVTNIPIAQPGTGWPVIRTNALPLQTWPTLCRLVECRVPSFKALREAFPPEKSVVVTLASKGLLAFGSDAQLQEGLRPYDAGKFDSHAIDHKQLHTDSFELGLLRDAFGAALEQNTPVVVHRKRSALIIRCRPDISSPHVDALRACSGQIRGTIPGTTVAWEEAIKARLEYRLGRLWLVIEPIVYVANQDETTHTAIANFVRERVAVRYNRQWNLLLDAWIVVLFGHAAELNISAFANEEGINATFTILRITGFSRRNLR